MQAVILAAGVVGLFLKDENAVANKNKIHFFHSQK